MRRFPFLSMLAITLIVLSACGTAVVETTVPEEPIASEAAATEAAAPAEGPRQLRVAFAWPLAIDPAVGSDAAATAALVNLYDNLVFLNADGSVSPWLAESWEYSDDGLTWTFKLKKGVLFHDGSELQASDVVYSFNRIKTIGEGYGYMFANIESAEAPDASTVVFKLIAPSGLLLPTLVPLYILNEDLVRENTKAEGPYGEEGDYGKDWLLTHDAGSGPYSVEDFQLEEYLLMKKNEAWWGKFVDNAPDEVRFIATMEAATIRSLMANRELEISDQWQSVESLKSLQEIDGVKVAALPGMMELYFMMHTKKAPLDDVHCRRAVAYAFDYDTAVGLEWPGTKQSVGPVPADLGGHNPDVFTFKHDVAKAKEELAQCKYADKLADYPVEIDWVTEVPDEEKFALLFQSSMAEIGLTVEIVSSPWLTVVENVSKQETSPHIVMIYISSDMPEAGPLLRLRFHSSTTGTWSQNEWLLDPALDAALDDALATVDQTKRYKKYFALQEQIAQLAPSLFVYDAVQKQAYQEYIDWPAVEGKASPLFGYTMFAAHIGVNPPPK